MRLTWTNFKYEYCTDIMYHNIYWVIRYDSITLVIRVYSTSQHIKCFSKACNIKTLSTLLKISADDFLKHVSYFSQKTGFDIQCNLSPMGTICMKGQIVLSGKYKKKQLEMCSKDTDVPA